MNLDKWNWTPRARAIGEIGQALTVIATMWFFVSAYWFILGGQ